MTLLRLLGDAPEGPPLTGEEEETLDNLLGISWTPMPLNWKQSITSAQLETLLSGIMQRFNTEHPTASTREAILYLMGKTAPNISWGGNGGGGGQVNISSVANNLIQMYPDGLYAKATTWTNKEW